jgi:hypothetical protein
MTNPLPGVVNLPLNVSPGVRSYLDPGGSLTSPPPQWNKPVFGSHPVPGGIARRDLHEHNNTRLRHPTHAVSCRYLLPRRLFRLADQTMLVGLKPINPSKFLNGMLPQNDGTLAAPPVSN